MKKVFILLLVFQISILAQTQMNINSIGITLKNNGSIKDAIFEESGFLYTGGFYLAGKSNDSLWGNGVFPSSTKMIDYLPGNVNSDSSKEYKMFVVEANDADFGNSWLEWKKAVEQGALFYDGNNDGIYNPVDLNTNGKWDENEDKPDLLGDYTAWCVYNDSVPSEERNFSTMSAMGIEIRQTVFAYNTEHNKNLSSTIFVRYIIENMGKVNSIFDSVYFGIATDPDIGFAYEKDYSGSDSTLNSIYAYKAEADDSNSYFSGYGFNPPSFFSTLLQGPLAFIPGKTFLDNNNNGIFEDGIDTPLDTAIVNRGALLGTKYIVGAKNKKMTAATAIWKSTILLADPNHPTELYNYLTGGKKQDGTQIIISEFNAGNGKELSSAEIKNIPPEYIFSGDPVEKVGWLCINPFDYRLINSTGPFELKTNDPIEIIAAYIVGRGDSPINSITIAKEITQNIIDVYQRNFTNIPVSVNNIENTISTYNLGQNYPNPFNPSTTIKYSIPSTQTPLGGFVTLKIYDILGQAVATLVDEFQKAGNYEVQFDAKNLTSGIYFYRLQSGGFSSSKKMMFLK